MKSSKRLKNISERFFGTEMFDEGKTVPRFHGVLDQKNILGNPYEVFSGEDEEGVFYNVNSLGKDSQSISSVTYYPSMGECDVWGYETSGTGNSDGKRDMGTRKGDFNIDDILNILKDVDSEYSRKSEKGLESVREKRNMARYGKVLTYRDTEEARKFNREKKMDLKESIKGNTKKFIQNVTDYLDSYCLNEQEWLNMEKDILNLQKYTRFHSLNEAIRDYVMGGSLDIYPNQVNDTLNVLYENTPEEAEKWEKYPDDKKWERYINIMCLYLPKAFKKKMGRELGKDIPEDVSKKNENMISPSRARDFIKMVSRLEEKSNIKEFNLAKIEGHLIEKIMKKRGIKKSRLLDESFKKLKKIEEDTFVSPTPKGLHRMKEDYGWEVPYDRVGELYDEMLEAFGAEELLESITRAMSTDNLADILAYICRMNDFDSDVFHDEEEYSVSVRGIEWDTDGEDVELPENCEIVVKASDEDEVEDLIVDALSDEYGFTVSSFEDYEILNEKKSSKGDSMKESKEKSLSYEEALKKVHSGEWDTSKFTESVVKGAFTSGR